MLLNEECSCKCHDPNNHMRHIVACCYECPTCHKSIKSHKFSDHKERCAAEAEGAFVILSDEIKTDG